MRTRLISTAVLLGLNVLPYMFLLCNYLFDAAYVTSFINNFNIRVIMLFLLAGQILALLLLLGSEYLQPKLLQSRSLPRWSMANAFVVLLMAFFIIGPFLVNTFPSMFIDGKYISLYNH